MNVTLQKNSSNLKSIEKKLHIRSDNDVSETMLTNCIELTSECLEKISGGINALNAVRKVGKGIAFPFRAVSYGIGAIIACLPKGFVDGIYDAWTSWEEYDDQEDEQEN